MSRHSFLTTSLCFSVLLLPACQEKPSSNDLFPLVENLSWHYDASFRAGRQSGHYKMIVTNQQTELDGETVTSRRFHNGDIAYYDKNEKGIVRLALSSKDNGLVKDPADHFLIRFPLETGTKWSISSKPFFLEKSVREINAGQASLSGDLKINPLIMNYEITSINDEVSVSAGKFPHCVRVMGKGKTTATGPEIGMVEINIEQTDWYSPGIGLVKSKRHEKTNLDWAKSSIYTMELDKIY